MDSIVAIFGLAANRVTYNFNELCGREIRRLKVRLAGSRK